MKNLILTTTFLFSALFAMSQTASTETASIEGFEFAEIADVSLLESTVTPTLVIDLAQYQNASSFHIEDLEGNVIFSEDLSFIPKAAIYQVDLSTISKGFYTLVINSGTETYKDFEVK